MQRIVFVTGNPGKLSEAQAQLEPLGIEVQGDDRGYAEVQAESLEEVCRFGLSSLEGDLDEAFMIEDAGLFVDALDGFPGVYSSYAFATLGNEGLLKLLDDASERAARFRSVIGFHDGRTIRLFEGAVEGSIAQEQRGSRGFGFDPVFVPDEAKRTFAEMTEEEKTRMSHRSRALDALVDHLEQARGQDS